VQRRLSAGAWILFRQGTYGCRFLTNHQIVVSTRSPPGRLNSRALRDFR
jgi:hypothetical protein